VPHRKAQWPETGRCALPLISEQTDLYHHSSKFLRASFDTVAERVYENCTCIDAPWHFIHLRSKFELQHQCGIPEIQDSISEQAGSSKQPSSQIGNANRLAETAFL